MVGVRDAGKSLVDIPNALAADLVALTEAIEEPGVDLEDLLVRLGDTSALAVDSFLGLTISLLVDGMSVQLSAWQNGPGEGQIATSATLPLSALGGLGPHGTITFFAAVPGAFVDLAADLAYALRLEAHDVQLDRHLHAPASRDGSGLPAMSAVNQAIGFLIERGHTPEDAAAHLQRLAHAGDVSTSVAAHRLITEAGAGGES